MKKTLFALLMALLLPVSVLMAQSVGENIDVTHYEIHVNDLNFVDRTMQAETFVDLVATASVQQIVLELKSLDVSSVTAIGATISSFAQISDYLIIHLVSPLVNGASATFDIVYGGNTYNELIAGGVEWWNSDYVYNLGAGYSGQPLNLGRAWFPCVDNFTDKATYDVYVTTTNNKKAICGGVFVETIDNGDGTSTWHWSTPQEIATYHISFAVGDYELWEDIYHGVERDIPITVYVLPYQIDYVAGCFVNIKEIMAFLEGIIGPYPFNRIGYVSTSIGCLEHTDNIAYSAGLINGTTSNEEVMVHELSHMWSGNKVTCAEAGDMWLNEGFAEFWSIFYQTGIYGEEAFQAEISDLVNTINTWCNNANNWMPLNNIPLDMVFDTKAVYERGAVIVNTLMNYMGRENFLAAMRQYFDQYAYQAASSEDLRDALTQYSGIDMNGFFDSYVFASGMPHLFSSIREVNQMGDQYEVVLDLRYQHIGDTHIGYNNRYDVTFIGPDFQLVTEQVGWDGLLGSATVVLDFEPIGVVNDFNNYWLDGRTQKNYMLKSSAQQSFEAFKVEASSLTDSVFVAVENHLVGPYDDPMIPYLTLSTKHFWTINRYDFGEAEVKGMFDYNTSADGDIIHSANDSVTLLYRRNASEAWHEIAYTIYAGSTWNHGRFVVDNLPSGEYTMAVWDKEALGEEEHFVSQNKMLVYPNPAKGQVRLSWDEVDDGEIRIFGIDGKELKRIVYTQAEGMEIAIEGLPQGCYTIMRLGKESEVLAIEKLIIK